MNFRRAKPATATFKISERVWQFSYSSISLVKEATGRPAKGEWDCDEWVLGIVLHGGAEHDGHFVTTYPTTGKPETFTYKTGTGHRTTQFGRRAPFQPRGMTVDVWESLRPTAPTMPSVLESLASDISTAMDMPADEAEAMDYLASELGMTEGKPSESLRMVRALRDVQAKVTRLLKPSGFTLEQFCEWARESES